MKRTAAGLIFRELLRYALFVAGLSAIVYGLLLAFRVV